MTTAAAVPARNRDQPLGFVYAMGAYLFWGGLPLYLKLVDHVPVLEVIAHRIIWSVPVAVAILMLRGRLVELVMALRHPRLLAMAGLTAAIITLNWGTYVYAIQTEQVLEAAIGYYMNPLFSVFLARFLLGERLNTLQWLAIGLAALAVAILTWQSGRVPAVALSLTLSWGFYAYFKKSLPLGPNQGFALEVILLLPLAIAVLVWQARSGTPIHLLGGGADMWLLLGLGPMTALPLISYAYAAKLLRLSTVGLMQYLVPTFIFLLAVLVFKEPFGTAEAVALPLLWVGLVIYTAASFRAAR